MASDDLDEAVAAVVYAARVAWERHGPPTPREPDPPVWAAPEVQGPRNREPSRVERREQAVARAGFYLVTWFKQDRRPTTELLRKAQRALTETIED